MEAIQLKEEAILKLGETEIIERILKGEKELFEILIRRNNQKLYRSIRSYLKVEAEIEDVMQNSYIKAYTKLYQFRKESMFSTWLIRIGINEALARLNQKGKLYYLPRESDTTSSNTILEIPDNKQLNPQERMIQQESRRLLEQAIDSLDPKYRIVYILKEVEEMSLKEIAQTLDLTVANIKVRLHRSKAMLKDTLFDLSQDNTVFEFGYGRCDRITENVMKRI